MEIKCDFTYFREQIKLRVASKKEVEKTWAGPNTGCFWVGDRFWEWGNRSQKPEEVLNLVFLLILLSQTYTDAVKVWTHWYMYTLYRSPADHSRDSTSSYYHHPKNFTVSLMGLRFWPWNFHQQGQGFHSVKEVREFVRGSGKVREIWYFLEKVREKSRKKIFIHANF